MAVIALALLPSFGAAWSGNGGFEPDTPDDVLDLRMWLQPDVDPSGMMVYFDAFPVDANTGANPNVGALGSRMMTSGPMSITAWLGAWKDCNQDGYIGLAETAATEYKPELLINDSVCPPGTTFNHHKWVTEFLHIGPQPAPSSAGFPRVLTDMGADVWGDLGRPYAGETQFGCEPSALPRGTLESTGTLLRYADCQMGYRTIPIWNSLDSTTGAGLAYDDPAHPENDCDHPLYVAFDVNGEDPCASNDPGTFESGTGRPMFRVYDCSTSPASLAPGFNDADGSLWDSIRSTCVVSAASPFNDLPGSDAYTNPADGKRRPDFTFDFGIGAGIAGFATPEPSNLGLTARVSSPWQANEVYGPPRQMGGIFRGTDFEPAGGIWMTFYAQVGATTLQRADVPLESAGAYGSDACGDADSGVSNGWDCSVDHWWNPAYGGISNPGAPRPGSLYYLRDTDCYDGLAMKDSGIFLSLSPLSNDPPCPRVS